MSKKSYAVLIGITAALLLGCLCGIGVALMKNNSSSQYDKYISVAQQCYENADYETAVLKYKEAIESDKKNEQAYIGIAQSYKKLNDMKNAVSYLELGYKETGSPAIKKMLNSYQDILKNGEPLIYDVNDVLASSGGVTVKEDLLRVFSIYSCGDYDSVYTAAAASTDTEKQYEGLPIIFSYPSAPTDEDMPLSVTLTSIDYLFNGFTKGVSYERLSQLDLSNLIFEYSEIYDKNIVAFDADGCHVVIESDESGNIVSNMPWNVIIISDSSAKEENAEDEEDSTPSEGTSLLKGVAYNEGDNNVTQKVDIIIYNGSEPLEKNICQQFDTGSNGKYRVELAPGKYYIEALIDEEVVCGKEFEIVSEGDIQKLDLPYSVKRELREGEIRVILSWDDPNANLDHVLEGVNSQGTPVYCCHSGDPDDCYHQHYYNDELVISSGEEVVGGPEEITVYDLGGYYEYEVVSYYSSLAGARVEVYTAGSDKPIVFECPSDYTDSHWSVFVYENGDVRAMS